MLVFDGVILGIPTILVLYANGALLGNILLFMFTTNYGSVILAAVVPHAIFEVAGFILAGMVGLSLSRQLFYLITDKNSTTLERPRASDTWLHNLKLVLASVILVFVGTVIEVLVTPTLVQLILEAVI
jgi:stage II sporulation protein M